MTAFKKIKDLYIDEIKSDITEYIHTKTNAKHYHIKPVVPFNSENGCVIAFNTSPENSNGAAHILEHMVLCGSKKYPAKDPFFMMINRSCATFMNAITYADKTLYPFVTENKKDFENLLKVYLDSVFHPNLSELDFLQEGWRLDVEDGELVYKGIVFNEMKGAYNEQEDEIYHNIRSALYKDSLYRHDSGGVPSEIVKLKYQDVLDFYDKYYHPSNSVFITYGDIPAVEHQAHIEEAISGFVAQTVSQSVVMEKHKGSATYNTEHFNEHGDNTVLSAWLTHDSLSIEDNYRFSIFSNLIFSPESALQKVAEKKRYVISNFTNHINHNRQTAFLIGFEGVADNKVEAMPSEISGIMEEISKQEFSKIQMHSIIDEYELEARERVAGDEPYALMLFNRILPGVMANQPLQDIFDIDAIFTKLRIEADNGSLIPNIFNKFLKPEWAKTIISRANPALYNERLMKEAAILETLKNSMSIEELKEIKRKNTLLEQKQDADNNESVLPELLLSDIEERSESHVGAVIDNNIFFYNTPNNVHYLSLFLEIPKYTYETPEDIVLHEVYNTFIENFSNFSDYSVVDSHIERSRSVADYHLSEQVFEIKKEEVFKRSFVHKISINGKNINYKSKDLIRTLLASAYTAKFDNMEKISFCLEELKKDLLDTNDIGPRLIKILKNKDVSATAKIEANLGIGAQIEAINSALKNLELFKYSLVSHHRKIMESKPLVQYIGDQQGLEYLRVEMKKYSDYRVSGETLADVFLASMGEMNLHINAVQNSLDSEPLKSERTAILGSSNVAYNYRVYKLGEMPVKDAASLRIFAHILNSKYLHSLIREKGGAYGNNVVHRSRYFIMSSYRDPNVGATFDNFQLALEQMLNNGVSTKELECAVIKSVGNIDSVSDEIHLIQKSFSDDIADAKIRGEEFVAQLRQLCPEDVISAGRRYLSVCQDYTYAPVAQKELLKDWNVVDLQNTNKKKKLGRQYSR